jgi:hypothetical protein
MGRNGWEAPATHDKARQRRALPLILLRKFGCGDTQHQIPAKRNVCSRDRSFARIVGCGGSQHPILAIGEKAHSKASGIIQQASVIRITTRRRPLRSPSYRFMGWPQADAGTMSRASPRGSPTKPQRPQPSRSLWMGSSTPPSRIAARSGRPKVLFKLFKFVMT